MFMPGVDPQELARAQEYGQHMHADIRVDYKTYTVEMKFSSNISGMDQFVRDFLQQFSLGLANQLQSYFAIKGKITELGKAKEENQPT